MSPNEKVEITDIVHGSIRFEPYFRDIIASEEFQRLRNIKQLGSAFMAYPSTVSTRYEHSIGVAYLATILMDTLEQNSNSTLQISVFHRKCVSIAGLLHDLGHGPFSHMWEYLMVKYFEETYHHEDISCRMLERLLRRVPNIFETSQELELGIRLIQSLIKSDDLNLREQLGKDMYLAEIISNKFSEIDVDRVDYILRDFFYMKNYLIKNIEPRFSTFLANAKVIEGPNGIKHINYLEDDLERIYELFKNRSELHKQIYQNPAVIAYQILLCEFFKTADDNGFRFNGTFRLNEVTNQPDLMAFITFDDTILVQILSQFETRAVQYEILKRLVLQNKQFRLVSDKNYQTMEANGYGNKGLLHKYKRSIEDPFCKFKIFLDRNILYNRNNNCTAIDAETVKLKFGITPKTDNKTFNFFVELD